MTDPPRLLLLDGHSLAYRAFFALPVENFSTTTGQPTNAVYGFTSMLINALRDEQPTHLAVAFDVSRVSFRSERFPAYKATRSETPKDFHGQVELVKQILDALGIVHVSAPGVEADDVLATLATRAAAAGYEVAILSGDRDALQLVDDAVTVLYPRKGVSDLARMTPAAVTEKYGVSPRLYPDLAALVGETSDNLPGVPGVGPGFAAKWLQQYESLAGIVDHVGEIKGKKGEALRAHLAQVLLNRELNALIRDLPLDVTLDELHRKPFDRDRIHEVFDALQFRVLRERLFESLGAEAALVDGEAFEVVVDRPATGFLREWLAAHAGPGSAGSVDGGELGLTGATGVAVAGSWGRGTGDVTALALAGADGQTCWLQPGELTSDDDQALASWFADPLCGKVFHDAKGPLLALHARGWAVAGLRADTALAAYLVLPGQRGFDLADLTARFLGRELRAAPADNGQLTLDDTGEDETAALALQARAVVDLAVALAGELDTRGGTPLLRDVELPLVQILADMEIAGIAVDLPHLIALEADFAARVAAVEEQAHEIVGRPFNLGSPKQLQEILFGERNLPKTKRIKTGYTTDADALQALWVQTADPLLEQLLAWRDAARLRQTVAGLIPLVDDQDRIHTTFNQMIAATGRLSSTDPNLQNIPIRTEEGRRIRAGFVVGAGFEALLTADYSQIEMRIMAHLSEDTGLIEAFRSGEDLHTTVASRVFSVERAAVDPEMRRKIKAMSYGLAYGLSPFGLSQQLGISPEEARGLMDEYFLRFGGVRDYLAEVVAQARASGYTETILGRRRYLPDLTSDNRQRREMAERMALNAPIQGSAADLVKVAMLGVAAALRAQNLASRLLLQVHDELVLEVAAGERPAVERLVREQMGAAGALTVPLDVSVGTGRTWQDAGH